MSRRSRAAAPDSPRPAALPRPHDGVTASRRRTGFVVALLGLPALTAVLVAVRDAISLDSVLLLYLLAVVVIAVIGGMLPSLAAAVSSFLLANWFLTKPYHTFDVENRDSVIALAVFIVVAATVSVIVDLAARRLVGATRSGIEAELLARFAAQPVAESSARAALELIRSSFGMDAVALVDTADGRDRVLEAVGGFNAAGPAALRAEAGGGLVVVANGPQLFAEDRRILSTLAATAARAWEAQRLTVEAARSAELAAVDRLRSALLAAVGHDLRTPLAGIKAAVSSLRQTDVDWTPAERDELHATIEESADRLDDLIANLLAMSRLQAGALSVDLAPTALDEVVSKALIGTPREAVEEDVPDDLPLALADAGLLERVVANLVDNAVRHEPAGSRVRVEAGSGEGQVRLRVVDHGPGAPIERWDRMFEPFQRFEDRSGGGVGLGLAIARGFASAMNAALVPSQTPGGGMTMTITMPVAR